MVKVKAPKTIHICTACGAEHAKWAGQCGTCGAWNTLVEAEAPRANPVRGVVTGTSVPAALGTVSATATPRIKTGMPEFDFVLGGGIVPGSLVLVGGEPGIGKSTLLLQAAAMLQRHGASVLYVSGEESPLQVKLRAERLTEDAKDVRIFGETMLERILSATENDRPGILIIDSIQTVATDGVEGAPGNVGQVRECAARLMRYAKATGVAVLIVGHVTKDGGIAGPKTLEHMVDTVLYFEGEGRGDQRVLRATKNRFGSVDEIAVFRMTASGLSPVENPSALFLGDRSTQASGSAVTALIEGTRPLLVEVQALASKAGFGTPQRVTTGFDGRRLALLLAVLDKRAGLSFAQIDVFANVVGGLRMVEPAGDLAIAAALASSVYDRPLPAQAVFIGEVGLGGEIRPVGQLDRRLAEAEQLGFEVAFVAEGNADRPRGRGAMRVREVRDIATLFRGLFGGKE